MTHRARPRPARAACRRPPRRTNTGRLGRAPPPGPRPSRTNDPASRSRDREKPKRRPIRIREPRVGPRRSGPVAQPDRVADDRRQAGRHGLVHDEAPGLAPVRRQHQAVGGRVPRADVGLILEPVERRRARCIAATRARSARSSGPDPTRTPRTSPRRGPAPPRASMKSAGRFCAMNLPANKKTVVASSAPHEWRSPARCRHLARRAASAANRSFVDEVRREEQPLRPDAVVPQILAVGLPDEEMRVDAPAATTGTAGASRRR